MIFDVETIKCAVIIGGSSVLVDMGLAQLNLGLSGEVRIFTSAALGGVFYKTFY